MNRGAVHPNKAVEALAPLGGVSVQDPVRLTSLSPGEARGYLPGMDAAHHQALVAERNRLARTFLDLRKGELRDGAQVTATPETIRQLADEIVRLTALIAKSRAEP